jgi:CHAD domain-containing protein
MLLTNEHELKLDAPAGFRLPELVDIALEPVEHPCSGGIVRSTELAPSGKAASLAALARRKLRRLRKTVRGLPAEPADGRLHEVRKPGERARYAAGLAGRGEITARAKKLQDLLGEHQDSVVAEARLRALAAEASPAEALAAGRLIDRERLRRAEARATWRRTREQLDRAGR